MGLANAVILAEPQSAFLRRWWKNTAPLRPAPLELNFGMNIRSEYQQSLRATIHGNYRSALYSFLLAAMDRTEHLDWIFAVKYPNSHDQTYANHLWENFAWKYLEDLTPGRVRSVDTNFHLWASPLIDGLSDD